MEETGFTLDGRVLCGDDACIGTIGPDRCCKLCGKPYEGAAEIGGDAPGTTPEGGEGPSGGDAGEQPEPAASADGGAPGERTCCPDDACTGIIGPDGACGVCGKKRAP